MNIDDHEKEARAIDALIVSAIRRVGDLHDINAASLMLAEPLEFSDMQVLSKVRSRLFGGKSSKLLEDLPPFLSRVLGCFLQAVADAYECDAGMIYLPDRRSMQLTCS